MSLRVGEFIRARSSKSDSDSEKTDSADKEEKGVGKVGLGKIVGAISGVTRDRGANRRGELLDLG
jgi:hypothetical protein